MKHKWNNHTVFPPFWRLILCHVPNYKKYIFSQFQGEGKNHFVTSLITTLSHCKWYFAFQIVYTYEWNVKGVNWTKYLIFFVLLDYIIYNISFFQFCVKRRKSFPNLWVGSCSQNAKKKNCLKNILCHVPNYKKYIFSQFQGEGKNHFVTSLITTLSHCKWYFAFQIVYTYEWNVKGVNWTKYLIFFVLLDYIIYNISFFQFCVKRRKSFPNLWVGSCSQNAKKKNCLKNATNIKWAPTWDFQRGGMCDQQRLRPACAYAQSDQSLC